MDYVQEKNLARYKREKGSVIIEVAVKNSRQLFNERDPAPFRERDLDPQFVTYMMSAIEEFPLHTKMKMRIQTADQNDIGPENAQLIKEAIQSYFVYESNLDKASQQKRLRTARSFALIGVLMLTICLSLAEFIRTRLDSRPVADIASQGLVIIGWVAMWRPIEALLYDWWPFREQRRFHEKLAAMDVEVVWQG